MQKAGPAWDVPLSREWTEQGCGQNLSMTVGVSTYVHYILIVSEYLTAEVLLSPTRAVLKADQDCLLPC